MNVGAIINAASFRTNPHTRSIFEKGLWGFSEKYRRQWEHLDRGVKVLVYGDKGIRMACYVEDKFESREPVEEWVKDPTGYPLRVKLRLLNRDTEYVKPIERRELVDKYGIWLAKRGFMGCSLVLFGDVYTYDWNVFKDIWSEFLRRNNITETPAEPVKREEYVKPVEPSKQLEDYVSRAVEEIKLHPDRFTESNVKAILVEPLLELLGWNTKSLSEVERDYRIPIGSKIEYADYVLKMDGKPRFLIEVKALDKDLDQYIDQASSYAKLVDVDWVILTNGRELRVYNARGRLLFKLRLEEYTGRVDKLAMLSKDGVSKSLLEEEYHRRVVLDWLRSSISRIAAQIAESNPDTRRGIIEKCLEDILKKVERGI